MICPFCWQDCGFYRVGMAFYFPCMMVRVKIGRALAALKGKKGKNT